MATSNRCYAVAVSLLGALLVAAGAAAQEHRLRVGLDLDLDDSTGCSLEGADSTGDQTATGFEWSVEVWIDPATDQVSAVDHSNCETSETLSDSTWGPPDAQSTPPWDLATNGTDPNVVELGIETAHLALGDVVRLAVISESAGGHRDTLFTQDGTAGGADILFPQATAVGALSSPALGFLALALVASALLWVRRSPAALAVWIAVIALSTAHTVQAVTLSLDTNVDEWSGVDALASDIAEDSETNDPAADLEALFVDWNGSDLALRIDFADLGDEVCEHTGTTCLHISESGSDTITSGGSSLDNDCRDSANPCATFSRAVSELSDGARLVIQEGTYQPSDRIEIAFDDVHIIGQGDVTLHDTIPEFQVLDEGGGEGGWNTVGADGVAASKEVYETGSGDRAWGRFLAADGNQYMLVSYSCYAALASTDSFYPAVDPFECEDSPYIGPGIFWDKNGDVGDDGRIYVRMDTTPEPLNTIVNDSVTGFTIESDPNLTVMDITVNGPRIQLEEDDGRLSNLTLELGSLRMGGCTSGNEFRDITLDGPSYDAPIEFYSGGSGHVIDGLSIDENRPSWMTWQDVKEIYEDELRYSAISFNSACTKPESSGECEACEYEVIHDITLRNSTIQNAHDGLELNLDAYHHVYILDNTFDVIQDDAIQLGSSTYDVEIGGNDFYQVGTGVSRHGTGANEYPGRKYIHHNYIDASKPKYYCREESAGVYAGTTCDAEGKNTLRGFSLHEGDGWELDGDPRYYYNNTVIVNADMIGIGLQGQDYFTELPYGQPSLVFNNVFLQLDPDESLLVESPKWSLQLPPVLITGGNLYGRPAGACSGGGFPGDLADDYFCDANDDCEQVCVSGPAASLGEICDGTLDCDTCSSGGMCTAFTLVGAFYMSGDTCDLEDFQDYACGTGAWSLQVSDEWSHSTNDVAYSWGLEDNGLFDAAVEDPLDFVPSCDTESTESPIDLTAIDGAYAVTNDESEPPWTLELEQPLPGVVAGESYRGHAPCVEEE